MAKCGRMLVWFNNKCAMADDCTTNTQTYSTVI